MEYKPCECPVAGYCERYKQKMSEHKWKLCQTSEKYRMLFDEIAGNANFGLWRTPGKGNVPKNIIPRANVQVKRTKTINKEAAMGILDENNKVRKAVAALEKENITVDTLNQPSEGLGDTVEKILTSFGITEKLVTKVMKRTCGCDARKKFLNKLIPYTRKKEDQ